MPKIRIKEIDNTGRVSSPETPNVVYIPGPASIKTEPELFTNASEFKAAVTAGKFTAGTLSEKMAYHLLTLGMHVLFQGFEAEVNTVPIDAEEHTFTINDIEYTFWTNPETGDSYIQWEDGAKEAEVGVLNEAVLEDGLMVRVTENDEIEYPVALGNVVCAIDSDNKFALDGHIYQINDNNIVKDVETQSVVGSINSGKLVLAVDGTEYYATFDFVNKKVSCDYIYGNGDSIAIARSDWMNLTDKNLYNVRFLTTGQFFMGVDCGVDMIECAATRCDAVALIDIATENNGVDEYRTAIETIVEGAGALSMSSTKDPATFGAAFAPTWTGNINTPDGIVKIENLPASFGYLCGFARSVKENPMWYAVAGSFRGEIPELTAVGKEYNSSDIERLQARSKSVEVALDDAGDNVGVAINPIAYRRPFGHLIWGNRTLRENVADDAGVGITKATSFLNCRILSTEVAKVAFNAANKYTFEQNSEILWTNFTSYILPTLDRMSTGNGILDYKIARIPTNKKARLCAKISLIPIEAVEDFDITIELTDEISVTE